MKHFAITGCPRSGATALAHSLNKDPRIFVADELGFYTSWYSPQFGQRFLDVTNQQSPPGIGPYTEGHKGLFASHDIRLDVLQQACQVYAGQMTGEKMAQLICNSSDQNFQLFGDKFPRDYLLQLTEISLMFPDLRFIVVMRDGRAVIASQIRRWQLDQEAGRTAPHWAHPTIEQAEYVWLDQVQALVGHISNISAKRLLLVRYEQAVSESEKLASELSNFLDFDIAADIFSHYRPTHIESWKHELPDMEEQLSKEFQLYLRLFGYEL